MSRNSRRAARGTRGTVVAIAIAVVAVAAVAAPAAVLTRPKPAGAATKPAYVRVDQVGYPSASNKVAYVVSPVAETGAVVTVIDAQGNTVSAPSLGATVGSWSKKFPFVYPVDFSGLATPGTYAVKITGPAAGQSEPFAIAAAANLYTAALANTRSFYETQRDGPDFIPSPLRTAPAHLNDAHAQTYLTKKTNSSGGFSGDLTPLPATIDASGGWFDAGDYLKFVETSSYVVALMLDGVQQFPNQLGRSASATSLFGEARFGLDWLNRMWDEPTSTLYYQVGIGSGNRKIVGDHDVWRLPQADDTYGGTNAPDRYIRNRPVFRAADPGGKISPNLAGRLAADFALGALVYRATDPAFADACLQRAETIYDLADVSPTKLLTVLPYGFYPETSWRDDLELGATEVYRALAAAPAGSTAGLPHTDPAYYLDQAATWAHAYITGNDDGTDSLNLYDVSGLAHFDLARAITAAGSPAGLAVTVPDLVADLGAQIDRAQQQAGRDPFGFGYKWASDDTVSHGAGLSVMASEYDALTGSSTYAVPAQGWLDNILGANAWGVSFVIGDGTTFPQCPQHQIANLAGSLDGSPPVLAGAAVEGPAKGTGRGNVDGMRRCPAGGGNAYAPFNNAARYKDNVQSYRTDEPAIDLTATSFLAFAWRSVASR